MSAEKISELDMRVGSMERMMTSLITEMKEDRAVSKQNNEAMIKLTSEMANQNKLQESVLTEQKEMKKTQNDLVTRVTVVENTVATDTKSADTIKRAVIGTLVAMLITGALSAFFLKGS